MVSGDAAASFLQGLITNDMDHLLEDGSSVGEPCGVHLLTPSSNEGEIVHHKPSGDIPNEQEKPVPLLRRSMYAMFLNTKGRVLFEGIIVHLTNDSYLINCDRQWAYSLVKHLKMYRLRKKIEVSLDHHLQTWAVFPNELIPNEELSHPNMAEDFWRLGLGGNGIIGTADPRVKSLGFRIFVQDENSANNLGLIALDSGARDGYKLIRHKLGVSEGAYEVTSEKAMALEYNADYLHGISFHKGCYIGQELTARTHHTGVVRKRIMPLTIVHKNSEDISLEDLSENVLVNSTTGNVVGNILSQVSNYAIGMMRVQECMAAQDKQQDIVLKTRDSVKFSVSKPNWWPKMSAIRSAEEKRT